jgi:membrane-bound serine protease (ClpP class)
MRSVRNALHLSATSRIAYRASATLGVVLVSLAAKELAAQQPAAIQRTALVLEIRDAIGPATAHYVKRGIETAANSGAAAVVILMDTPGGLDASMREIIQAILSSPIPVVTYVHPSGARAASAGTYILYASHVAAMTPGTNLGAATPITIGAPPLAPPETPREAPGGKGQSKGEAGREPRTPEEAKAVNDAVAFIRSLAELRGRNVEWAEKAVREAASLSATEAAAQRVVDLVAPTLEELLQQLDGREVKTSAGTVILGTKDLAVERLEPDWRTRLFAAITNPNIALILMMIGLYGLIFELMNPGTFFPGTVGIICLLLGLYGLAVLPISLVGVVLVLLGLTLLAVEAVTPSFGVLGAGGAVALALGLTMLVDTTAPGFQVAKPIVGALVASTLAFSVLLVPVVVRAHRRHVVTGREELIGLGGEVLDWSGTRGHVFVRGERWRAVAGSELQPGTRVRVTAIEGLTLTVEPDTTESHQPGDGNASQ